MEMTNSRQAGGTGDPRPNFDEIASQILEAYGCVMGDEHAPTSFPKWKWRKLLAEAARMGAKAAMAAHEEGGPNADA